jgi:hypothetical protein
MGLYNTLFGMNPNSSVIMALAGISKIPPRFRDASIAIDDEKVIVTVFCRQGGGNRSHYIPSTMEECDAKEPQPTKCCACSNAYLSHLPSHIDDLDDEFDSTYNYHRFDITKSMEDPNLKQIIEVLLKGENPDFKSIMDPESWKKKGEEAAKNLDDYPSLKLLAEKLKKMGSN